MNRKIGGWEPGFPPDKSTKKVIGKWNFIR